MKFSTRCATRTRCRDWPELTAALRHEGIATEFRMRGGTSDVQGVVFARNGYPFNGSKIDRQFSFSKIDHALSLNRRQALSANERGSVSNPVASFSHLLEDLLQPVYDADEERRLQERLRKKEKTTPTLIDNTYYLWTRTRLSNFSKN